MNLVDGIKLLFLKDRKFARDISSVIGFVPYKTRFYRIPFVHKASSIPYKGTMINNERLEYLGDAVLDAVVADFLFKQYQNRNEGFLSQMRSKIVKRQNLNDLGLKIGLHYISEKYFQNNQLGKNFYGDALEALIGAVYLTRGYSRAKKFILESLICEFIDLSALENTECDHKSRLIEWAQKHKKDIIFDSKEEYAVTEKAPFFICLIYFEEELLGQGSGSSKKEAEQNAAEQSIKKLKTVFDIK